MKKILFILLFSISSLIQSYSNVTPQSIDIGTEFKADDIRVITLSSESPNGLSSSINNWLKTNPNIVIIDIQYQSSISCSSSSVSTRTLYSVLIIYRYRYYKTKN